MTICKSDSSTLSEAARAMQDSYINCRKNNFVLGTCGCMLNINTDTDDVTFMLWFFKSLGKSKYDRTYLWTWTTLILLIIPHVRQTTLHVFLLESFLWPSTETAFAFPRFQYQNFQKTFLEKFLSSVVLRMYINGK